MVLRLRPAAEPGDRSVQRRRLYPEAVVVPVILSMQEILNNQGEAQLMNVFASYIAAAERALEDAMDAGIYSRRHRQRQQAAHRAWRPRSRSSTNTGIYGGIDRADRHDLAHLDLRRASRSWRDRTQVNSTTIRPMLNYIMTRQSRGRDYADLLLMSPEHYAAYDAATIAIQRQTKQHLARHAGLLRAGIYRRRQARRNRARRRHRLQHAGQYNLWFNTDSLRLRYHPTETSTSCSTVTARCRSIRTPSRSSLAGWANSR